MLQILVPIKINFPDRRISAGSTSSIFYAMKTRIITMAGIAICSLFVTTMASPGQTVTAAPASHTTVIREVPAPAAVNTFVKALDNDRYQLIEKRDNKEVYRDSQTGEKWILEIHHRNG